MRLLDILCNKNNKVNLIYTISQDICETYKIESKLSKDMLHKIENLCNCDLNFTILCTNETHYFYYKKKYPEINIINMNHYLNSSYIQKEGDDYWKLEIFDWMNVI